MSETPRTDALAGVPMTRKDSDDFARQLERELTTALAVRKEAQDHQLRLAAELMEARKDKADLDFLLMCIATDEIRCQRGNGEFLTILRGMDGFRSAIRAAR